MSGMNAGLLRDKRLFPLMNIQKTLRIGIVKIFRRLLALWFGLSLLFVAATQGHALEAMPVERLDLQAKLLHTVIRFSTQVPEQLVVAVVYSPDAKNIAEDFQKELLKLDFNDRPIQVLLIPPEKLETLASTVNVIYVTPGNADRLDTLAAFADNRGIFTVTGIPKYVEAGKIALGFGEYRQKPQIILCFPAAKRAGHEFKNPKFLNLQTTGKLRIVK